MSTLKDLSDIIQGNGTAEDKLAEITLALANININSSSTVPTATVSTTPAAIPTIPPPPPPLFNMQQMQQQLQHALGNPVTIQQRSVVNPSTSSLNIMPVFDGKGFSEWCSSVSNKKELYGLSDQIVVLQALGSLTKDAEDIVSKNIGFTAAKNMTWDELSSTMSSLFQSLASTRDTYKDMCSIKQGKLETIFDYYQRKQGAISKLNTTLDDNMFVHIIRDGLIPRVDAILSTKYDIDLLNYSNLLSCLLQAEGVYNAELAIEHEKEKSNAASVATSVPPTVSIVATPFNGNPGYNSFSNQGFQRYPGYYSNNRNYYRGQGTYQRHYAPTQRFQSQRFQQGFVNSGQGYNQQRMPYTQYFGQPRQRFNTTPQVSNAVVPYNPSSSQMNNQTPHVQGYNQGQFNCYKCGLPGHYARGCMMGQGFGARRVNRGSSLSYPNNLN